MHKDDFPTIFAIAMDYLAIQASSVPCERAFSSSTETDTARHNRISPILMEALQMLKFGFRNEPFNFGEGLLMDEQDLILVPDTYATDLLAELALTDTTGTDQEDAIDHVIAAIGE
jgi:hypothetical protein